MPQSGDILVRTQVCVSWLYLGIVSHSHLALRVEHLHQALKIYVCLII